MNFYSQEFKHLKVFKLENHQLWITLDNESQSNAITLDMIDSLTQVLKYADFDQDVRVIILKGMGKNFCSGGDIKAMEEKSGMFKGESNELRLRYSHGIQQIPRCIESLSTPILAMVNGAAIGAGCDLSMMCDLRIGSEKSKFGETFTRMGLVPGDGGTFFLTRTIGYAKAMQMFLTSEIFEGQKAYEFGLLNFIVEDANLEKETKLLAEKIASLSPVAQGLTKKAMKLSYLHDLESALDMLSAYQGISQRTNDHFEAINSFNQKRPPQFSGT